MRPTDPVVSVVVEIVAWNARIVPVRIGISCVDAEIDVLVRTTSNTRIWFGRDVDAQR
jgi:hypothetical protein